MKRGDNGFTLIEVLLAIAILGAGIAMMLTAASRCLAVMKVARAYQRAQWVRTRGEAEHYVIVQDDVSELEVPADTSLAEGFAFSREVGADIDDGEEDGLYPVRTRVWWGDGDDGRYEEIAICVFFEED